MEAACVQSSDFQHDHNIMLFVDKYKYKYLIKYLQRHIVPKDLSLLTSLPLETLVLALYCLRVILSLSIVLRASLNCLRFSPRENAYIEALL